MAVTTLRKDHSLVGRTHMAVIKAVREFGGTLPDQLARLKKDHPLDNYTQAELVGHIEGLLDEQTSDLLQAAGVEGWQDPLSVAKGGIVVTLHSCILEVNAKGQPRGVQLEGGSNQPKASTSRGAGVESDAEGGEPIAKKLGCLLVIQCNFTTQHGESYCF